MPNENSTAVAFLGGLLLGATAGYLMGVLMAPASGQETRRRWRRQLEDEAAELRRKGRRVVEDARGHLEEGMQEGQKKVRQVLRS